MVPTGQPDWLNWQGFAIRPRVAFPTDFLGAITRIPRGTEKGSEGRAQPNNATKEGAASRAGSVRRDPVT